jgi:RNA polymerase sigma-70 factor (ECF subfamily)
VIFLYYYEGYSIKEIASILEKSENTVGSLLRRGRAKLKIEIEEA